MYKKLKKKIGTRGKSTYIVTCAEKTKMCKAGKKMKKGMKDKRSVSEVWGRWETPRATPSKWDYDITGRHHMQHKRKVYDKKNEVLPFQCTNNVSSATESMLVHLNNYLTVAT